MMWIVGIRCLYVPFPLRVIRRGVRRSWSASFRYTCSCEPSYLGLEFVIRFVLSMNSVLYSFLMPCLHLDEAQAEPLFRRCS